MPIQSFGIYSAIIIAANYFLIITLFPSVVVWYENNLEGKCCPCQKSAKKEEHIEAQVSGGDPEFEGIEKFFEYTWNSMIEKIKYPVIAVFLIWIIVALTFAVKLTPLTKQEEFLAEDHPIMEIQNL